MSQWKVLTYFSNFEKCCLNEKRWNLCWDLLIVMDLLSSFWSELLKHAAFLLLKETMNCLSFSQGFHFQLENKSRWFSTKYYLQIFRFSHLTMVTVSGLLTFSISTQTFFTFQHFSSQTPSFLFHKNQRTNFWHTGHFLNFFAPKLTRTREPGCAVRWVAKQSWTAHGGHDSLVNTTWTTLLQPTLWEHIARHLYMSREQIFSGWN